MTETNKKRKPDTINSRTRPRLVVIREYTGFEDMRSVIEQVLETLILEKYDEMLLQRAG